MIGAIILGLVAGLLARVFSPRPKPKGFIPTLFLGLAGAAIGFLVFTELLGVGDTEVLDLGGLPGAVIGAMLLLYLYRRFTVASADRAR